MKHYGTTQSKYLATPMVSIRDLSFLGFLWRKAKLTFDVGGNLVFHEKTLTVPHMTHGQHIIVRERDAQERSQQFLE